MARLWSSEQNLANSQQENFLKIHLCEGYKYIVYTIYSLVVVLVLLLIYCKLP